MKIDKYDKKILFELTNNSRTTYTALGNKINLSKEATFNRVKKLEKSKIINAYQTKINYSKLGYNRFRVFAQLHNKEPHIKKKLLKLLMQETNIVYLGELESPYEFQLVFKTKGERNFQIELHNFRTKYQKFLEICGFNIPTYIALFPRSEFWHNNANVCIEEYSQIEAFEDIDLEIIKNIEHNTRYKATNIANKLKISVQRLKSRIKKLEENGIILQYTVLLNIQKVGYNITKLHINLFDINKLHTIKQFAFNTNQCRAYTESIGGPDAELKFECKNHNEFSILLEQLKKELNYDFKNITYHHERPPSYNLVN